MFEHAARATREKAYLDAFVRIDMNPQVKHEDVIPIDRAGAKAQGLRDVSKVKRRQPIMYSY